MDWPPNKQQWKYLRIEALFFVVFFYVFPILSDLEYNFIELHKTQVLLKNVVSSLLYGSFDIIASVIFYKLIQRYLFVRRFGLFALATIIYLVFYHFFRMAQYLFIGHISWFPEGLRIEALKWYNAKSRINFSTVYMCMEFLCIASLAYFIRSSKQDEQVKTLKEQQLISELSYLKAQIHPHFFFNTINNIYSLALQQSADTAPMVAKLAEMMRYILYEASQQTVSLDREIEFLTNYIAIEQIRHQKANSISFDVQGIAREVQIEPLLLLPFVENAFKHGLQEETAGGFVSIVICMAEQELTLEVCNSKPVYVKVPADKGIGLDNVLKRLKILYPNRYLLRIIDNDENQHQVLLTLQTA